MGKSDSALIRRLLAVIAAVMLFGPFSPVFEREVSAGTGVPAPFGNENDDTIRTLIKAAGEAADYPGAAIVRVFDRTDVDVEESGLSHTRHYTVTKILTDAGCLDQAALRFDYDPTSNFVDIRSVRIFRASGEVEDIDVSSFADAFQPAHMLYWGMRMKVVALPRLEKGDAVEVKTYMKGFLIAYLDRSGPDGDERYIPPMRGHFYDMILFEETVPIKEKTYTVHTIRNRPLQYDIFNGQCACSTTFDEEKYHYTWKKTDIPAVHPEPRAPDSWDYVTKVVMATVGCWEEKSRWFEKVNRNQFDSNEAIQAKVEEVVKGCRNDDEKATALLRWVANNIRYSGLTMGEGEGYTLHPGWMIFEERAGVCKDIAGMLVTMMRAAGIETYAAMTMAGARVEYIPADQFNHCVVARKMPDGTFKMYDPTWCPLSMTDWSLAETEQHYVVGSPEGESLESIAYHPPEDCLIRVVSDGCLLEDGTLQGVMTLEGRGWSDTYLRRILIGYNSSRDVARVLEGWLLRISPRATLTTMKHGDYRDLDRPVAITLNYTIPEYALVYNDRIEFRPPAAQLLLNQLVRAASATRSKTRTQPLFLYLTARHVAEETIRLPAGYKLSHAADPRSMKEKAGDLATSVEWKDGSLQVKCNMAVNRRSTPPDQYPGLYKVMEGLRSFVGETVTLSR